MKGMKGMLPSFLLLLLMLQVRKLTAHPTLTQADKDEFKPFLDLLDYLNVKDLLNSEDLTSDGEKVSVTANFPESADAEDAGLICIPGIASFSKNGSSPEYYDCSTGTPVLTKCPRNQLYSSEYEMCEPTPGRDMAEESPDMEVQLADAEKQTSGHRTKQSVQPTFGQEVYLGNLFDARRQSVYSSDFVWSQDKVKANKHVRYGYSSNLDFTAVKSTLDRMALMDISAFLKLDFLGGLIHVEGSARYFKETVQSESIANVVMEAHYKTRSETIASSVPADDINLCKIKDVTHVVTGIIYGMDAYFDFRKEIKTSESRESITGALSLAIKSIPNAKIEGGGKVSLNGSLTNYGQKIRAKVRGDFILSEQPTTYAECIKIYKELASHLGPAPTYPRAVPKRMILTPIKRICDDATIILLKIKESYIALTTKMMDEIEKTKIKAKTIRDKSLVRMYLAYEQLMNLFVNKVEKFELEIKGDLQKVLPMLRSGRKGELDLNRLLAKYKKSPFNFDSANVFLKTREKEILLFEYILNPATYKGKNVHFKYKQTASMIESVIFSKPKILILKLNVLPDKRLVENFINGTPVDESKSWFKNNTMIATMGAQWRRFMDFAEANKADNNTGFIVEVFPFNENYCNVFAMKEEKIVSKTFDVPATPSPISVVSNHHNKIEIHAVKPTNAYLTKLQMKKSVLVNKKAQETNHELDFQPSHQYSVTGLEPNTKYHLTVAHTTVMGTTHYSTEKEAILTRPCSPPTNVKSSNIKKYSASFTWDEPVSIGKGVTIEQYSYSIKKDTGKLPGTWQFVWTTNDHKLPTFTANIYRNGTFEYINPSNPEVKHQMPISNSTDARLPSSMGWKSFKQGKRDTVYLRLTGAEKSEILYFFTEECTGKYNNISHYCSRAIGTKQAVKESGTSTNRKLDLDGLEPATHYVLSIKALAALSKTEKSSSQPSDRLVFVTPPAPPSRLSVVTSYSSADVTWKAPEIADGATVRKYLVRYAQVDTKGKEVRTQTIVSYDTQAKIKGLVQGLSYAVSVKVITSMGDSDFSPRRVEITKHHEGDLSNLKKGLSTKINNLLPKMKNAMKSSTAKVTQIQSVGLKMDANDKIPQSRLPAGYSQVKAADLQMEQLHMAAAAACWATVGGTGYWANVVFPRSTGKCCSEVCYATGYKNCDQEVSIHGRAHLARGSNTVVGYYKNYECDKDKGGSFEPNIPSGDTIDFDNLSLISFCCCRSSGSTPSRPTCASRSTGGGGGGSSGGGGGSSGGGGGGGGGNPPPRPCPGRPGCRDPDHTK